MMMGPRGRGAPLTRKSMANPILPALRKPRRLSVTVPSEVLERLTRQADEQGRSTSNLAAYLLELSLGHVAPQEARELWAH